ncbi:MAG: L-threonylcarbamoyladenylate synthase [Thermodesulfobacteriota bacterium]
MTGLLRLDEGPRTGLPPEVIASLREGGMVICPTDTLYGIAVDPRSAAAVARLVAAKSRDRGKPIPLLLSGPEEAARWAREVPNAATRLMRRFWPGALTLVLPAAPGIHPAVTGGGDTVGLRVPDHPVPRELARGIGGAVTGTSANRGGEPGDWKSPEELVREFSGEADWILWSGASGPGPGSTVVRATDERPSLLREGAIPFRVVLEYLEKG